LQSNRVFWKYSGTPNFHSSTRYWNTPLQVKEQLSDWPSHIEPQRLTAAFQKPPAKCLRCLPYPLQVPHGRLFFRCAMALQVFEKTSGFKTNTL
jgi:hypothetical protein